MSSTAAVVSRPSAAGTRRFFSLAFHFAIGFLVVAGALRADQVISETGTLADPEDTALIDLTLTTGGTVTLQTFGFGGGTNGASTVIPAGGFDAFVGLFQGTGPTAEFINGTSDVLTNYSPGCPPAGFVTIGSVAGQCGDVNLQFAGLAAGTYTVLLSDAAYLPEAVFETSPAYLGDGFVDFTGGAFQTCVDANDCNSDTANWALDITAPNGSSIGGGPAVSGAPEPGSTGLAGIGLAILACGFFRRRRQTSQNK